MIYLFGDKTKKPLELIALEKITDHMAFHEVVLLNPLYTNGNLGRETNGFLAGLGQRKAGRESLT